MRYTRIWIPIVGLIVSIATATFAEQDPGWPRKRVDPKGTLLLYQPQVDEWKDFTDITWREAFTFTPTGGKEVVSGVQRHHQRGQ